MSRHRPENYVDPSIRQDPFAGLRDAILEGGGTAVLTENTRLRELSRKPTPEFAAEMAIQQALLDDPPMRYSAKPPVAVDCLD